MDEKEAESIFVKLLEFIGENPNREGLKETPHRMFKAWKEWTSGYGKDPKSVLKTFEDGAEACDQMVCVKEIPFYSHCEHHLAPFFGYATVAYLPNKRIVGLSKIARVLDIFAKRLQVQERLTSDVALALNEALKPKGVGVFIRARHLCMESRGICKTGHYTVTSFLSGVFRDNRAIREEFYTLANVS
jgi:GTP cyclohydrolase I